MSPEGVTWERRGYNIFWRLGYKCRSVIMIRLPISFSQCQSHFFMLMKFCTIIVVASVLCQWYTQDQVDGCRKKN